MAEPTEAEKAAAAAERKNLAEAFADGIEIFSNREAERKAKEGKTEGGNDDGGNGTPVRRSLGEFLLGRAPAK